MIPLSRTITVSTSVSAGLGSDVPESPSDCFRAERHCRKRCPRYSTRNERKTPAIRMAAVVPSYFSSPRHSLANMSEACVKSCSIINIRP